MKTKVFLIIVCIVFGSSLTAQEIQNFSGNYTIQEICTSGTIPNYSDTIDYEIEIKSSSVDTFDIQFYLEAHFSDTIRAKLINDSAFQITLQTFQNFDNSLLSISGEGSVIQDSIKINYSSGGSGGEFECTCKGIKKKETGLNRNLDDNLRIKVFPNPVKEFLYLNLEYKCKNFSILIYNSVGNLVMNRNIQNNEMINVSELTFGTYFYSVIDGNNKFSGHFIKE